MADEDVVDLLLAQHARIEELFLLVVGAGTGDTRRNAFDDLARLLVAHETAEQEVVHPLSRTLPGGNVGVIEDRVAEELQAREMLRALVEGGVDADGFDAGIVLLRETVLKHARYEERYEFPRLRQHVPADQLRDMAGVMEER